MWQIHEYVARFTTSRFAFELAFAQPWLGLSHVRFGRGDDSSQLAALKLGVRELLPGSDTVSESYIRGRDLVVTYAHSAGRNVQTQLYVSPIEADEIQGCEIVLSAQTHLLDSRPAFCTETTCEIEEAFALTDEGHGTIIDSVNRYAAEVPTSFLLRPRGADYSYLETVAQSDFTGALLKRTDERVYLSQELFPDRLEKGVIRRARLAGFWLPRHDDLAHARHAIELFAAAPLPLTT